MKRRSEKTSSPDQKPSEAHSEKRGATHQLSAHVRVTFTATGMLSSVDFGSVTVEAPEPSKNEVKRNIKKSQEALARAKTKIIRPGIKIDPVKNVPLFHVDPEHPNQFIRELNGKRESGIFENGKFKVRQ